ncbi:MAG: NUDIX domain-containing protein [Bacteroidales bacterium]|nr:NUDIX domain-containing protein [Bacteroidales bacterium]
MYKVFFNDRYVLLTDDFIKHFQLRYGLFYKFRNEEDLKELVDFYRKLKKINTLFIFHYDLEELRNVFKSCFHNIEAAGGLVRDPDNRLLIIKRRGKWDLPKGKIRENEKPQQAALREVEEECGITGLEIREQLISTYHAYMLEEQHILKKTFWYDMIYAGERTPVPQHEEDITEIRWFKTEELQEVCNNTYLTIMDVLRYAKLIAL